MFVDSIRLYCGRIKATIHAIFNARKLAHYRRLINQYEMRSPLISANVANRTIVTSENHCGVYNTFDVVYLDIIGEILTGVATTEDDPLNAATALSALINAEGDEVIVGFIYVSRRIDLNNISPYEMLILEHEIGHHIMGHSVSYAQMNSKRVEQGLDQKAVVVPEYEFAADKRAIEECLTVYSKEEMREAVKDFEELLIHVAPKDEAIKNVCNERVIAMKNMLQ